MKDHFLNTRETSTARSQSLLHHQLEDGEQKEEPRPKTRIIARHRLYISLFSVAISLLSVATPLLTAFANAYQSHSLYTGFMMLKGQLPYTDIFATGGFLYYLTIALSYFFGSSAWLILVQFLAFVTSGTYLYKIICHMTTKPEIAINSTLLFYLLNFALGFGGLYPIQLAAPFVFISLWFLTRYFAGLAKDEGFIIYGLTGALAYLIEPRTLFFWLVSLFIVSVQNMRAKKRAHHLYQFLCVIFGGLLVFYVGGYFVIDLQILPTYIKQAGYYHLTHFALGHEPLPLTLLFQVVVLFASGLLMGALTFFKHIRRDNDRDDVIKVIIFVTFLLNLVFIFLTQSFDLYQFIIIVPFGLVLTALYLDDQYQNVFRSGSRRRKRQRDSRKVLNLFVMGHFYLPYLVLAYSLVQPIYAYVVSVPLNQERQHLVTYLRKQTQPKDKIYAWDYQGKLYLDSNRKSSTLYPIPTINTISAANHKDLEDELLQNEAKVVLVNKQLALPKVVADNLATNYEKVNLSRTATFTVFQKK